MNGKLHRHEHEHEHEHEHKHGHRHGIWTRMRTYTICFIFICSCLCAVMLLFNRHKRLNGHLHAILNTPEKNIHLNTHINTICMIQRL